MSRAVLLVDENESRRGDVRQGLAARGVPALQVKDAFEAMAALGRAEFGCVVVGDARRRLSLRGLCHLARRRHPNIHLCVLLPPLADEASARAQLGVPVTVVDGEMTPEQLAEHVIAMMKTPLDPFVEQPSREQVDEAIAAAYADADAADKPGEATASPPPEPVLDRDPTDEELTAPDAAPPSPVDTVPDVAAPSVPEWEAPGFGTPRRQGPPADALLEGVIDEDTAPALLMGILAQELTGRLEIAGGQSEGRLYFYLGEPVAADHARGNEGMLQELEARDLVPHGLDIRFVPEGELLATMVTAGNVTGGAMMRFVLEFVKDRLLELAMQREGTYRFVEDERFLDVAPLVRVNPFGVVLQTRRETTMPTEVQMRAEQIEGWWLAPRPALKLAAGKLSSFLGDREIDEILGEHKQVKKFWELAKLDEIAGALLVDTLLDARLVELTPKKPAPKTAMPETVELRESNPPMAVGGFLVPEAVEAPVPDAAAHEETADITAVREDVLSLYMRLKPVAHPRQVLGVALHAGMEEVEEAYRARMAELDPARVPAAAPDRDALVARISELRGKVMRAMEVLQYQAGAPPGAALPATDADDGDNPF